MIRGQEFHSILQNIFVDVNGYLASEQLQVNCPHCQERDGLPYPDGKFNLEINTAKRMFRCWKCEDPKFSGSLGRLIKIFGSNADYELYKSYAGVFHDYLFEEDEKEYVSIKLPNEIIYFSQMDVKNPEHFEAYNYLINDRKLSRETILKYRLGFCTTGKYEKRIIIPSYDIHGEVNYFVARNYDTNNKRKKPYDNPKSDKDTIIFNEGLINWDSTIYLVEGVFEMFSLPTNAIPLLGKTMSSALFKKLMELKPNIIILLDPDAHKDAINLFYLIKAIYVGCDDRVKLVKLPELDDLDEIRRKEGNQAVIKYLRTARELNVDDYFYTKLQNPYDKRKNRYSTNRRSVGQRY